MEKIESLDFLLMNNIKKQYFYYELSKQNFGIFSLNYCNKDWLYIKPIRYRDYRLDNVLKNTIDYQNIKGKDLLKFLTEVDEYCFEITQKQFNKKWEFWLESMTNAWKIIKW